MNHKVAFLVLALLLAALGGCTDAVTPFPAPPLTPTPEATAGASRGVQLAQDYFAALVRGDEQAAKALVTPGARCTPGDFWDKFDSQLATLSSAEIRNIAVSEWDISHIVEIYAPDAQAACVAFEYKQGDNSAWSPANLCCVVEVGICDMWFTEEE